MTRRIYKFGGRVPEDLAASSADVARLTRPQREQRVQRLVGHAGDMLDQALDLAAWHGSGATPRLAKPREVAGVLALFSGGNDSTTLAHLFRDRVTGFAHANTTVGLEATREYVRATSSLWGVPLLERSSPKSWEDSYAALVRERGFPGPGQHYKMFQRLKEHALYAISREIVTNGNRQRVVFVAGRRREESRRRADVPELERRDSIMWVSPLVAWTKMDLNTYRLMCGDVPVNEVADLLHMSGECLCGAFAQAGELEMVLQWFASDPGIEVIRELEDELAAREDIPPMRRKWGWGAYVKDPQALMARSRMGALCGCVSRLEPADDTREAADFGTARQPGRSY
jgi:3'-phosphoadenosine 5'-phosphosulfate sulfotransferase (PAPS reductase)/FAD synthetase